MLLPLGDGIRGACQATCFCGSSLCPRAPQESHLKPRPPTKILQVARGSSGSAHTAEIPRGSVLAKEARSVALRSPSSQRVANHQMSSDAVLGGAAEPYHSQSPPIGVAKKGFVVTRGGDGESLIDLLAFLQSPNQEPPKDAIGRAGKSSKNPHLILELFEGIADLKAGLGSYFRHIFIQFSCC